MVNPALATAAVGVVEPARAGMASGINSTFRQVGIATGIAAWGAIFQSASTTRGSSPRRRRQIPARAFRTSSLRRYRELGAAIGRPRGVPRRPRPDPRARGRRRRRCDPVLRADPPEGLRGARTGDDPAALRAPARGRRLSQTRVLEIEGDGPGLILFHGFGDSADTWRPLLDVLAPPQPARDRGRPAGLRRRLAPRPGRDAARSSTRSPARSSSASPRRPAGR